MNKEERKTSLLLSLSSLPFYLWFFSTKAKVSSYYMQGYFNKKYESIYVILIAISVTMVEDGGLGDKVG